MGQASLLFSLLHLEAWAPPPPLPPLLDQPLEMSQRKAQGCRLRGAAAPRGADGAEGPL